MLLSEDYIMEISDLQLLEAKIDALIQTCKKLADENQSLRKKEANLMSKHSALLEKHSLVNKRLETIITRLKSMEVNT